MEPQEQQELIRYLERQRDRHEAASLQPLTPEVAIATFRYLLEQTAAIDTALGRDPYHRWLNAKGRGAAPPPWGPHR